MAMTSKSRDTNGIRLSACRLVAVLALACGGVLAASPAQAVIDQSLLAAVLQNDAQKIANLARQGTDLNGANDQGMPPLHIALQQESWTAAQALIAQPKTDVNLANGNGETPLMLAAIKGRLDLVKLLIARGAYVNREGWTPLHYAASNGQPGQLPIIRLLLEQYAFINARSPNDSTPLMMAAGYGSPEAVKLLIDEGAFLDVKNQQGMSALDFASRTNRVDIAEIIGAAQRAQFTGGKW